MQRNNIIRATTQRATTGVPLRPTIRITGTIMEGRVPVPAFMQRNNIIRTTTQRPTTGGCPYEGIDY
jgi:hypothetical protein